MGSSLPEKEMEKSTLKNQIERNSPKKVNKTEDLNDEVRNIKENKKWGQR